MQHVFLVVVAVIHVLVLVILDAGDGNGYDDDYSYNTTGATTTLLRLRLGLGICKDYGDCVDDHRISTSLLVAAAIALEEGCETLRVHVPK